MFSFESYQIVKLNRIKFACKGAAGIRAGDVGRISFKVSRNFTLKSRPESGLDCLICAIFARQRSAAEPPILAGHRKVDIRLPGKGNSNSHGARPVHQIISISQVLRAVAPGTSGESLAGGEVERVRADTRWAILTRALVQLEMC